ncbi:MAG: DUF423 domain-containing protein [Chitinophagales bacterium]
MTEKNLKSTLMILGFAAVVIGAFGAHGLRDILDPHQKEIYEKGVHYQFFHVLAGWLVLRTGSIAARRSALFFILGVLLFSGSLYLLATAPFLGLPMRWLGPLTPIGGVCFLLGWAFAFIDNFREA